MHHKRLTGLLVLACTSQARKFWHQGNPVWGMSMKDVLQNKMSVMMFQRKLIIQILTNQEVEIFFFFIQKLQKYSDMKLITTNFGLNNNLLSSPVSQHRTGKRQLMTLIFRKTLQGQFWELQTSKPDLCTGKMHKAIIKSEIGRHRNK